jgi:ribosomal protein S18 acetylase RimI-like enzyme
MTNVRVELAGPEDWETYRSVRLAALAESPSAFFSTLAGETALDPEVWRERLGSAATFLAWQDSEPVGTVTLLGYRGTQEHGFTGASHIVAMWVSPDARRLGVGRLLVQTALDQAASDGAASVVLWVFEANKPAQALYESMGFRATDQLASRPGAPEDVEFLMIREFGEP